MSSDVANASKSNSSNSGWRGWSNMLDTSAAVKCLLRASEGYATVDLFRPSVPSAEDEA